MRRLSWFEKITSYFTGTGLIYVVSDVDQILSQTDIVESLKRKDCILHYYNDPVEFRLYYESHYRHVERSKRPALLIVISNNQFNQIPYDVYEQATPFTLSIHHLFPLLDSPIVGQCPNWMYEAIYQSQKSLFHPLNGMETADFLLKEVCSIPIEMITDELTLWKSAKVYYDQFPEGLPEVLLRRLGEILSRKADKDSLQSLSIFSSKKAFNDYSYQKSHLKEEDVCDYSQSENSVDIHSLQQELFHEDYSSFERSDWLRFANELGQLQNYCLKFGAYPERFQEGVEIANEVFGKWMQEKYTSIRSLPVVPTPKMVHHIPHYLAKRADKKIALVVLDGMSFTQWHLIKANLLRSNWQAEEESLFAWVPSVTAVSRQSLFSGLEPRLFSQSISTTQREKDLWTHFWVQQGFSKHNIAFEKSLGLQSYSRDLFAYRASPSIRIYGAVIDVVDQFMHGAVQGLQTLQSELRSWLQNGFLENFLTDLAADGFEVYLTSDHGNVESIGRGRINQGVTVESKGERARIYQSRSIRDNTSINHPDTFAWDDPSLPNDYYVLLAQKNRAFVPKNDRIVSHGGIHIEEMIVPFVRVYR